jgi:site-specific DNA-methyltransferase (adenine-specific)
MAEPVLYKGDALHVLRGVPTASVDAVITDPPYSSGGMVRGDRMARAKTKYVSTSSASGNALEDFTGDNRDQRGYGYWSALWLGEALRVVRPGGTCVLFTDWRQLPVVTDALQAGGWIWRGIVPWAKASYRPQVGRFAAQCEYAVWGSAGAMRPGDDAECLPGFFMASPPREREHITQKPLDVMRQLVRICPRGGTVLDPFMGAGTTGVAALNEGRSFVGIELSDHYFAVAEQRVKRACLADPASGRQAPFNFEHGHV